MSRRMREQWVRAGAVFLAGLLALGGAGCASRGRPASEFRETAAVPNRQVALLPGDVIELKFYKFPDLNETQTVRPDGKIMLQLIGELQAEGKTLEQLQGEVRERYLRHIEKPDVAVMVRQFNSRVVFVGGAVENPGKLELTGNLTVLDAIMQAGGFRQDTADIRSVLVVRTAGGKHVGYPLDLKALMAGGEDVPFYLHPHDVVYVPRTAIVNVDDWISQHFYKLLPQLGFFVSWDPSQTTTGVGTR